MTLWQWLFYTEDETQTLLLNLEKDIMALSNEVTALQSQVASLQAADTALATAATNALAAVGQPGMSAEDKAALTALAGAIGTEVTNLNGIAQKLAAATPPAPPAA